MVLHDVVGGAGLHRLDRDLLRPVCRHDDDRQLGVLTVNRLQAGDAVLVLEPVVEEHGIHTFVREAATSGMARGDHLDGEAGGTERAREQLGRVGVVLDDQHPERHDPTPQRASARVA